MNIKVGFCGGGRIVRILLEGWERAGSFPQQVVVSDPQEESRAKLQSRFPKIFVSADNRAAAEADLVFLAVHPPVVPELARQISGSLRQEAIVVSLAPRWKISALSGYLGGFARLARAIPNAPSIVNAGLTPLSFGEALNEKDRGIVRSAFASLGQVIEVEEHKLEGYAVLSGMGPTYFWFQFQTLLDLAEQFQLTKQEAQEAISLMIQGAIKCLFGSGLSPQEVMDLVPVRPLAEAEPLITELYQSKLRLIYDKIRPQA